MRGAFPPLLLILTCLGAALANDDAAGSGSGSAASTGSYRYWGGRGTEERSRHLSEEASEQRLAADPEVARLPASRQKLTADLKVTERALGRAARDYSYKRDQFQYLSQQVADDETDVAELRRKLRRMTAERNDLRKQLYSGARRLPGWARMTSVDTRTAPASTADAESPSARSVELQLVDQQAVRRMMGRENEKMRADIALSERRNADLRGALAKSRRQFAQDMGSLAARVGDERRELGNFTQVFRSQQEHLAALLGNVVSPWEQQWREMARGGRLSPRSDAAVLEPEMHMKAFQEMQSFDASMREFAQVEACFFDERMGGQQQQLDVIRDMAPSVVV